MEIIYKNKNRFLVKENKEEVNINDNNIIIYSAIYYKSLIEITPMAEVETSFIGIIEGERFKHHEGIIGIYVKPIFIWDKIICEWKKIINYKNPNKKYFYYPHLLTLPNKQYDFLPLYYLHTCKNTDLKQYENIDKTFDLQIF